MGKVEFPRVCTICADAKVNAALYQGTIELALKPFEGTDPWVLLAGQDPTVVRRKIDSVLDLENPCGLLYEYIVYGILKPVGLELNDVYATNLIKCRFPSNQTPGFIARRHHMSATEFLYPFFSNCKSHFVTEVKQINPRIILSFGQPVHQILVESFAWNASVPLGMKEAFGKTYSVDLLGHTTIYVPCVHINSRGHSHYKNLRDGFTQNLRLAVDQARGQRPGYS